MHFIQCENNHYYSDKLLSCPYCANQKANVEVEDIFGRKQQKIDTVILSGERAANRQTRKKTVGWLVCIEGEMAGESFVLYEGENIIGRAAHMDVALLYENTVSREGHASIRYDGGKNHFMLYSLEPDRDVISLGNCSLVFVAFCDSSFSWDQ